MKTKTLIILSVFFFLSSCSFGPDYWPTEEWKTATPESQGMDSETLAKMLLEIDLSETPIDYISVIRNGYIVLEAENYPYSKDEKTILQSASKSFTSAMVGRALQEGFLDSLDQSALDFFPEFADISDRETKEEITIRDLLLMASGIDFHEHALPYEHPENLNRLALESPDPLKFYWDRPMIATPGTYFSYNGLDTTTLAEIVSRAGNQEAGDQWSELLLTPLGIEDSFLWVDDQYPSGAAGGLFLKPRDFAKLGFLYLNQGRWEEAQLIPEDYIQQSIQLHEYENFPEQGYNNEGDFYGYQWWVFPEGYYAAQGLGSQRLFIWPEKNLLVTFISRLKHFGQSYRLFQRFIIPALLSDGSIAENPEGQAKLERNSHSLAQVPEAITPNIPPRAGQISGQYFELEENSLGIKGLTLEFDQETAWVSLDGASGIERYEIGLDGIFRESILPKRDGHRGFDEIWQLRGYWRGEDTFYVEMRSPHNRYDVRYSLQFSDDSLEADFEINGAFNQKFTILGIKG